MDSEVGRFPAERKEASAKLPWEAPRVVMEQSLVARAGSRLLLGPLDTSPGDPLDLDQQLRGLGGVR